MEQEHMYMIVFAFCIIGLLGVCAYVGVQEPNTIQPAKIQSEPIKQPNVIQEIAGNEGDWGIVSGGVTTIPLSEPDISLGEADYGIISKGSSCGLSDMVSLDEVEELTEDIPLSTTDIVTDVMESADNSNASVLDIVTIPDTTYMPVTNGTESEVVIVAPIVVEPVEITPIETKPIETVTPNEEKKEEKDKEVVTKPVEKDTKPEEEEEEEETVTPDEPVETPAVEAEEPDTNDTVEESPKSNDTEEPEQNETVEPTEEPTETPTEEETPAETPTEESTPEETETPAESEQITPDNGGNSTPV